MLEGDTLTITVDLSKEPGLSASGKSTRIASTGRAVTVESGARVNLPAYRKTKSLEKEKWGRGGPIPLPHLSKEIRTRRIPD